MNHPQRTFWVIALIVGPMTMFALQSGAATYYVDNAAIGANNGTDWANAWTGLDQIAASSGDTVYFSGGATAKTYTGISAWVPISGVTYSIGQDENHNGMMTWDGDGADVCFRGPATNVTFTGLVGMAKKWVVTNYVDNVILFDAWTGRDLTWRGIIFTNMTANIKVPDCSGVVLDQVDFYKMESGHADLIYGIIGDDINHSQIINCRFWTPAGPIDSGLGDDTIKWIDGATISNCTFTAVLGSYSGGEHGDSIQTSGSNLRVCNNTFVNALNANFFLYSEEPGLYHDILIYNNLFYFTANAEGYPRCIEIRGNELVSQSISNVWIVGNTFVDTSEHYFAVAVYGWVSVADSGVENNLYYNTGAHAEMNAGLTVRSNKFLAGSEGGGDPGAAPFLHYTPYATTNDYHLVEANSDGIANAAEVISWFSADKDGVTRGSSWDIGAYELTATAANPPAISVHPADLSLAQGDTLALSVTASGSPTLYYQWKKNGTALAGATASSYSKANVQTTDAATYSVVVGNAFGTMASSNAVVTVILMPRFVVPPGGQGWATNGLRLSLTDLVGCGPVTIYVSTNGADWEPMLTNAPVIGTLQFVDTKATNWTNPQSENSETRFYYATEQW